MKYKIVLGTHDACNMVVMKPKEDLGWMQELTVNIKSLGAVAADLKQIVDTLHRVVFLPNVEDIYKLAPPRAQRTLNEWIDHLEELVKGENALLAFNASQELMKGNISLTIEQVP